jgi:Ni/Co efflux regulator RcnB
MKTVSLVLALSFAFVAPVFACPAQDAATAKTAKKADPSEQKDTAQKAAPDKAKADGAKKAKTDDKGKVSMK